MGTTVSILVDGAEEEEEEEEEIYSSMPPGGMEEEPPPPGGRRRRLLLHAVSMSQLDRALQKLHEGMEEEAHLFLIFLLHATWRHGGGGDGCYCKPHMQMMRNE